MRTVSYHPQECSILIVTRNRQRLLRNCLEALTRQSRIPGEVVVIENHRKKTAKRLCQEFQERLPIRYLYEKKQGRSYARNKALEVAHGELLLFLDDDCIPQPDWVEEMLNAHNRIRRPIIAVVGISRNLNSGNVWSEFVHHGTLRLFYQNTQNKPHHHRGKQYLKVGYFDSRNASIPRRLVTEDGLRFNTSLLKMEDIQFGHELVRRGIPIICNTRSIVFHSYPSSLKEFLKFYFESGMSVAMYKGLGTTKSKEIISAMLSEEEKEKLLFLQKELMWQAENRARREIALNSTTFALVWMLSKLANLLGQTRERLFPYGTEKMKTCHTNNRKSEPGKQPE
ncbi:MAG TPA: glycosyltransferase family 2 protein [Patescibacteria group bacterium]|nr:glycosyltransferase family 2 protein [Patescibacteria group bacterium]